MAAGKEEQNKEQPKGILNPNTSPRYSIKNHLTLTKTSRDLKSQTTLVSKQGLTKALPSFQHSHNDFRFTTTIFKINLPKMKP